MGIVSESDALTAAEIKLQAKTNRNKITNPGAGSGYSPESSPKTNYLNPPHRPMVDQMLDLACLKLQLAGFSLQFIQFGTLLADIPFNLRRHTPSGRKLACGKPFRILWLVW